MKVKVKLRPMVALFNLQNEPIRKVLEGTIPEELLKRLEEKYPTLGEYQEAEKKDLVGLTSANLYEEMKEQISDYIQDLLVFASYVTNAELLPIPMRVAYGKLASDAELYFMPIFKLQERLERLSEKDKKFIEAYYGLSGKGSAEINKAEIAKQFGMTVDEVSKYRTEALSEFK